jgi:predicted lipoprotein with Yx(FWY)xxD motif
MKTASATASAPRTPAPQFTTLFATGLVALTLAACAGSYGGGSQPARMQNGMLVGSNGMTLYTFDKDAAGSGKSVCNGPCATNWPPLMAMDGEADVGAGGDWSIVVRDDGKRQWAHRGKPLYFWAKDQKPGDTTGDGFNQVWRIAR